jgi:ubiquinone/menaquinone biosynthesis C-methylase UbiE
MGGAQGLRFTGFDENQPYRRAMKLHLGCGKRMMGGYINVDLDARKNTMYQYVQSDVSSLPFDSDTCDEILAVHVIEHIWLWELKATLQEWLRVLKPGGKVIIECPDILKAANLLIAGYNAGERLTIDSAMRAFYGDPKDREIQGRHKWGWTPQTLAYALEKSGFNTVQEDLPQYHWKDVRDMRITALK